MTTTSAVNAATQTLHTFKLSFRPLRADSATRKKGEKRGEISISIANPMLADTLVNAAVLATLESYARELVNAKSDDWDYLPSVDDLTLANWHNWNTDKSRSERAVTAVTLEAFAKFYAATLQAKLGKNELQASTGAAVIRGKFQKIAGNAEFCRIMLQNIENVCAASDDSELAQHEKVIEWILVRLSELTNLEVSADAL